ncbi:MAG: phytanoyl-CoA dioxygenase family protein [Iamia sp.]
MSSGIAERIASDGHATVRQVLDEADRTAAIVALERIFASEADIADERRWATDAYRVAYALPAKDPLFLSLCTRPAVLALAREVLGDDCVLAGFNGQTMQPQGSGQPLHRDHPVPTPGMTMYLHAVCALDRFTVANGATRAVTASHRGSLADRDPADLEAMAVPIPLDAGDVVAFDGSLVHAAGANTTTGPRRALHLFFGRPWVVPHWDFPATFGPAASTLSEEQRRLLGFNAKPRRFDLAQRRVVR